MILRMVARTGSSVKTLGFFYRLNHSCLALKSKKVKRNMVKSQSKLSKPEEAISMEAIKTFNHEKALKKHNYLHRDFGERVFNVSLKSLLSVAVHSGNMNLAQSILDKYSYMKKTKLDTKIFNIVMRGWALRSEFARVVHIRILMAAKGIALDSESYAYLIYGHITRKLKDASDSNYIRDLLQQMKDNNIDPRTIFQSAYFDPDRRQSIRSCIKSVHSDFSDLFFEQPIHYDNKLLDNFEKTPYNSNMTLKLPMIRQLPHMAKEQLATEYRSSIPIKSVAAGEVSKEYRDLWIDLTKRWRSSIAKTLEEKIEILRKDFMKNPRIHLYPYLICVERNQLLNLIMDEVEECAVSSSYSSSTTSLHLSFAKKVMFLYFKTKGSEDGSTSELMNTYYHYLKEYCSNPELMGKINSRQYIQNRSRETKNYAAFMHEISPNIKWPRNVLGGIGQLIYQIILKEVKFDPDFLNDPTKSFNEENLIRAFYTAYFPFDNRVKIKEEFRSNHVFEKVFLKCCSTNLKFDYSFLPAVCPPMPWTKTHSGGYLIARNEFIRLKDFDTDSLKRTAHQQKNQKLYPTFDSLNILGLCPWKVNTDILDIAISIFKSGGDANLSVPLNDEKFQLCAPLREISIDQETDSPHTHKLRLRAHEQKRSEMYSLWRDCLYKLSIANHFRKKIFWFPHNVDFRGRTYPIPPHFHHLGADLSRSLLLFGHGLPLGDKGLYWLKIHLVNLLGSHKHNSLSERLEYANSLVNNEVLDSADNPLEGQKWWMKSENPWQVLACCKEIARAVRSENPSEYVSHFPIHQDGSCNGLQHYAALGRDPNGARAVNLVPCDRPQDVYSQIVEIAEARRKRDAELGNESAKHLEGFIQRKVIKQTVMTTVYGVTRYGSRKQIARQLVAKEYPESWIWKDADYLSRVTFDSIGQMFEKSQAIRSWFIDCVSLITEVNSDLVKWENPVGFTIYQPYVQVKYFQKDFTSCQIALEKKYKLPYVVNLNRNKQKAAFPPNYIHSLDSSHMMLTSIYCYRAGLTFVSVHDCFWTHASTVDEMNRICRQQFYSMHSEPLLGNLSKYFIENCLPNNLKRSYDLELNVPFYDENASDYVNEEDKGISSPPDGFTLEYSNQDVEMDREKEKKNIDKKKTTHSIGVLSSIPKQGTLDLKVVLDSIYFFS